MTVTRDSIAHVARSVREITGCKELVVIGSAALIAALGEQSLPADLFNTEDIDIFALDAPDEEAFADELETIGYGSLFHETNRYFADGVSPYTATMPVDWLERAIRQAMPAYDLTLIIPDPNDIAVAKLCAWRDRDRQWLQEAIGAQIISLETIASRITELVERPHGAEQAPQLTERQRRLVFLQGRRASL